AGGRSGAGAVVRTEQGPQAAPPAVRLPLLHHPHRDARPGAACRAETRIPPGQLLCRGTGRGRGDERHLQAPGQRPGSLPRAVRSAEPARPTGPVLRRRPEGGGAMRGPARWAVLLALGVSSMATPTHLALARPASFEHFDITLTVSSPEGSGTAGWDTSPPEM